ncbi:metalloenzyme domain protein [Deinococcus sp. NW-56]|uniref:metalloenzyme domain protein n=1 Tax=Deinococcus sp. NW-56 TaxID=2080419 RepID=UPI000CF401F7|nr:metalloenzyme domain protein [Deinococcus sp. NW-56]
MTGLVWLALDGVGHPADAPPESVWETELPALRPLVEGGEALDATLGVPGLPQSGTGQSCWLTGRDAVRVMGEHFGPHPGPTLRRLLAEWSLPVRLTRAGGRAALANHYPPAYHAAQARRPRPGCFPYAFQAAGLPLGPPEVPPVSPTLGLGYAAPWPEQTPLADLSQLGERLARAARTHDLIAADLWLSDLLGHRGRVPVPADALAAGRAYLRRVDALLAGLLEGGARVIVSSDHGNLENLAVKGHTLARVPFAGAGLPLPPARDIVTGGRIIARWLGFQAGSD